jgi:hypothetical protein
LKREHATHSDKNAKESTADDYFRQDVKTRLQADSEQLTRKKTSRLKFKVEVPPMARFWAIMEMSLPATGGGRPLENETARVIKAEAFRRLTNSGLPRECQESESKMSKLFHIDKPESVRYELYRGIVNKHKDKIKEFLRRLKK